jgi:hypothetical protein
MTAPHPVNDGHRSSPDDEVLADLLAASPSLPLIQWHMTRYDELRSSVAHRAAMVLSAAALLLAGVTFLLDNTLSNLANFAAPTRYLLLGCGILLFAGLALSVFYAIRAVVSLRPTRTIIDGQLPMRLFFNSRDTVGTLSTYREFRDAYARTSPAMMSEYALRELFTGIYQYHYRYRNLRKGIWLLFVTIILFLAAMLVHVLGVLIP